MLYLFETLCRDLLIYKTTTFGKPQLINSGIQPDWVAYPSSGLWLVKCPELTETKKTPKSAKKRQHATARKGRMYSNWFKTYRRKKLSVI